MVREHILVQMVPSVLVNSRTVKLIAHKLTGNEQRPVVTGSGLGNGDLYLHKEPWNWEGWFSRDFEKPRKVFRGETKETRSIESTVPANTEKTSIGSATMEQNGTIVLPLRAEGPNGVTGDALIRYSPNHPEYKNILKHVGGLKKGEVKPVHSWPDK